MWAATWHLARVNPSHINEQQVIEIKNMIYSTRTQREILSHYPNNVYLLREKTEVGFCIPHTQGEFVAFADRKQCRVVI